MNRIRAAANMLPAIALLSLSAFAVLLSVTGFLGIAVIAWAVRTPLRAAR